MEKIEKREDFVKIRVNPKIYPLPIVYQAADIFIDNCYVFLDGDPEKEIEVILKPKEKADLEKIAGEFNNELLNYAALLARAAMNKEVKELMLKRAFFTVKGEEKEKEFEEKLAEKEKVDIGARVPIIDLEKREIDEDFNLEEIMKPWEEQKGAIKEER